MHAPTNTSDNQAVHEQEEENRHGNRRMRRSANSHPKRGGNRHSARIRKRLVSDGREARNRWKQAVFQALESVLANVVGEHREETHDSIR